VIFYGKKKTAYEPLHPEGKIEKFFYDHFIRRSPRKASLNLALLAALIVFFFTGEEYAPWNEYSLYIWLGLTILIGIIKLIYWSFKIKKIDQEMYKVESELAEIKKELKERQEAFNEIKKEMLDQN